MTARKIAWIPAGLAACAVLLGWLAPSPAAEAVPAVLIQVGADKRPTAALVDPTTLSLPAGSRGLIVWVEGGREQWRWINGPWAMPGPSGSASAEASTDLLSRSAGRDTGGGVESGLLTTQLEQLGGAALTRDGGFLTPWNNGRLLDGRLTFRRKAGKDGKLPAVTAAVLRDDKPIVRIPIAENQTVVKWSEIPNLPKELANGLPPGRYLFEQAPERAAFTVEEPKRRNEVLRRSDELARLLGGKPHVLAIQVAVEEMLAQMDEEGKKPQPYLADALDLLESTPAEGLTPHLRRLREQVVQRLQDPGRAVTPRAAETEATGVKEIDEARDLIAGGQWKKAAEVLDAIHGEDSPVGRRKDALAFLYRGVVLAESGQAQQDQAEAAFHQAIGGLTEGEAADLYRAHNNFADFLLTRSQDRLYNHAFQMAAGVQSPLLTSLKDWIGARDEYEAALAAASKLGPAPQAAVKVNLARVYALLVDVLRTAADPRDAAQRFPEGEKAADEMARRLAEEAATVGANKDADPLIAAAAEEILAHLAFRADDAAACQDHARKAGQAYAQAGSLVGAESIERLLGLSFRRTADAAGKTPAAEAAKKEAVDHFKVAQALAEVLRERYPADKAGLSRAGFFSRRAYVNEQIVDLLIDAGKDTEALRYAELAKARALQDLLAAGRRDATTGDDSGVLDDLLLHWPKDTAALEYYLGAERGWVFVVKPGGGVKAYVLNDAEGRPLATRDLVARVRSFLAGIRHQAPKISAALDSGRGFDHAWQDDLNRFYKELIPAAAVADLRQAKTLMIVPHHILHYLPFASLVTERDAAQRGPFEMVQPKFLLDEPFDLCYAPSLTAWGALRQAPSRPIIKASAVGIVQVPGAKPLKGVAEDMKNLKAAFGAQVGEVLSGAAANKDGARRRFKEPGLLFVATHGWNEADRPLQSFLLLCPHEGDDGRLTAGEIYSAEVNADLVVMSACFSGLADRSPLPGDDLFGLQRAFLEAGARCVVSGQWDVYDGTGPELMRGLVQGVASGKPAAASLAASQREFLAKLRASKDPEPWLHPYFWAVYTAAGDDRVGGR